MKFSLYTLMATLAMLLILPLSVSAQDEGMDGMEEGKTIAVLAGENADLTILNAALQAANLAETLNGEGPFTVFAPTDEAFRSLPEGVFDALLKAENRQALVDILSYHVAEGTLVATDVVAAVEAADEGRYMATSLNGDFTVMLDGGNVILEDSKAGTANVVQADVTASNGVIHVIDAVLLPENIDVDALLGNGDEDGMEPELGEVDNANGIRRPVDEPTNELIAEGDEMRREAAEMEEGMEEVGEEMSETTTEVGETMEEAGEEVVETGRAIGEEMEETGEEMVEGVEEAGREVGQEVEEAAQDVRRTTQEVGSDVTEERRETSDTMEPMDNRMEDMGNTTRRSDAPEDNTIVDVAAGNQDFRTLVTAVEAADLVDVLASDGEFTVFAPTESAFAKLPEGTVGELTQESNKEKLQGILTYHVVAAKIDAATLTKAIEANNGYFRIQTMGGGSLIASMEDGNVILTDGNGDTATVVNTDVAASNGVIHVIDTVLMPRSN